MGDARPVYLPKHPCASVKRALPCGAPEGKDVHMSDPHATVTVSVHSTPDAIFSALARVFPVTAHDKSRWVHVPSDGVTVTFYAEHVTTTDAATVE